MILFPHCKINLGLSVVGKRSDGFHDIESIFYSLPLKDVLEIVKTPQFEPVSTAQNIQLHFSGLEIPGKPEENICVKAYEIIRKDFPDVSPIQFHLHKIIPIGSGLGGGSSDGAFMLKLLNELLQLRLSENDLMRYAADLGSDCAFFIQNQPCLASGRGEILKPISLDLSAYSILLVYPNIHINTAWAFSAIKNFSRAGLILQIVESPIESWKNRLINDFEELVISKYPVIGSIKQKLYDSGALYASMTGSGSSVFGIFPKNQVPQLFARENYFQKICL